MRDNTKLHETRRDKSSRKERRRGEERGESEGGKKGRDEGGGGLDGSVKL